MRHYNRHHKDRFVEKCSIPIDWLDDFVAGEENFKGTKCRSMHIPKHILDNGKDHWGITLSVVVCSVTSP